MNSDFDPPVRDYSQARQEAYDRPLLRREKQELDREIAGAPDEEESDLERARR